MKKILGLLLMIMSVLLTTSCIKFAEDNKYDQVPHEHYFEFGKCECGLTSRSFNMNVNNVSSTYSFNVFLKNTIDDKYGSILAPGSTGYFDINILNNTDTPITIDLKFTPKPDYCEILLKDTSSEWSDSVEYTSYKIESGQRFFKTYFWMWTFGADDSGDTALGTNQDELFINVTVSFQEVIN